MSYVLYILSHISLFRISGFAHGKYLWSTGVLFPRYIPLRMSAFRNQRSKTTEAEFTPRMVANVTSCPLPFKDLDCLPVPPTASWPQLPRYLVDEFLFACKDSWSPILVSESIAIQKWSFPGTTAHDDDCTSFHPNWPIRSGNHGNLPVKML